MYVQNKYIIGNDSQTIYKLSLETGGLFYKFKWEWF